MKKTTNFITGTIVLVMVVALFVGIVAWGLEGDEKATYLPTEEVRYVGEKIIQNSESRIYEYEYEFKTKEGDVIYFHSPGKKNYNESEKIRRKKYESDGIVILTEKEFCENVDGFKNAKNVAFFIAKISAGCIVIYLIISSCLVRCKEKKEKQARRKMELWKTEIPYVANYLRERYKTLPRIELIVALLDKLRQLIKQLDLFYEGHHDEKKYRNGFRKEIENVIHLVIENIETDKKFDKKLIKEEFLEEFYHNLEKFISYIESEMDSLISKNDEIISKKFDKINSEAELSGEAIKHLAEKYNK